MTRRSSRSSGCAHFGALAMYSVTVVTAPVAFVVAFPDVVDFRTHSSPVVRRIGKKNAQVKSPRARSAESGPSTSRACGGRVNQTPGHDGV